MRAERVVFTLLGVVLGSAGVWLLRGERGTVGTDGTSGSDAVERLTRRVAELEAEARRPAELAAPTGTTADGSAVLATPPGGMRSPAREDPELTGVNGANADSATSTTVAPARFFRDLYFGDPAASVIRGAAEPRMSAADAESKLRYGTDAEKEKALEAIVNAPSKDYLAPALTALDAEKREPMQRQLIGTIARLKDRPWSALQVTGAPDTPIGGDLGTAWASASGDMGEVTLDLTYEKAVRVDRVRVHETHAPGAISKILAKASDGSWDVLWEGRTPAVESPNWFAPTLQATRYTTATIRLVLDTDRVPDWNEIDAVELEGDGLRQWATGATASSSYADR